MTKDEELAEAYNNSRFKSNESRFSKSDVEQAFLAGLKAGRLSKSRTIFEGEE